jgi:hypothetical protein
VQVDRFLGNSPQGAHLVYLLEGSARAF